MESVSRQTAAMKAERRAAEAAIFDQTNLLGRKQLITVVAVLACCQFICFTEQTGIGVALPAIGRDLDAEDTISWAATSALISNTIFQVLYGRLSDLFGRKPTLLSAISLLVVSNILCGLAQNDIMLYVFRGVSGVANGGVASLTAMIVSDICTLAERGKYQGIIGAAVGVGNMVGPFIAAGFVEKNTWRGFFLDRESNCCYMRGLPTSRNQPKLDYKQVMKSIDFGGIFSGSLGLILILIPVAGGGDYFEWDSPMVIGMLTSGGVCMVAFIYIERNVALLPMMPLSLFTNPPVAIMLGQNFLLGMVAYSQTFYLPLFFQNARRLSPVHSACLMLPLAGFQATASVLSGQYVSRRKRYAEVLWSGFFLWTLGAGLTCMFNADTPFYTMIIILIVTGIGIGLVFQPILTALQAHSPKSQRAIVISSRNFIRSLGGAVGLAVSAAVLQHSLYKAMPVEFRNISSSYDTPDFETLGPKDTRAIVEAYATGSRTVFIMNVPLIAVCLVGCFFIKNVGLHQGDQVQTIGEEKVEEKAEEKTDSSKEQDVAKADQGKVQERSDSRNE
ncbi:mfs transporter [Pyrenophora seminiperda CCB06]|uniref:Mfs transporter n=1 Tax=Pyrenophora seminiperda CCB06 TaxID=1302712 RepID=A0A3M7M0M5_9PLEO|nr:mfs transporter [Pyrenophora seminiperda CCB06]